MNAFKVDPNQVKKISPSPSKKYSSSYYKNNPSTPAEYDSIKRLKSPSPPAITIPNQQNLVGLTSNSNIQNGGYSPATNPSLMNPTYNMPNIQNLPNQTNSQAQGQNQSYPNPNFSSGPSNQQHINPSVSNTYKNISENGIYSSISKDSNLNK